MSLLNYFQRQKKSAQNVELRSSMKSSALSVSLDVAGAPAVSSTADALDIFTDYQVARRNYQNIFQTVNPTVTTTTSANPFTNGMYKTASYYSLGALSSTPRVYLWNGGVYYDPSEKLRAVFLALRLA